MVEKKLQVLGQRNIMCWEKNHGFSNNPFLEEKKCKLIIVDYIMNIRMFT